MSIGSETSEHQIINCDATPFIPNDVVIWEHRRTGQIECGTTTVQRFLVQDRNRNMDKCFYLRDESGRVMNACVLDHILKHPHLFPKSLEGKRLCFPGTIFYSHNQMCYYVRFLYLDGGTLRTGWLALGGVWRDYFLDPAAPRV